MKKVIIFCLFSLFCVYTNADAQAFRGGALAAYELQGPVKSVCVEYEINFSEDGKLVEAVKPQILKEGDNTVYRYDYGDLCVDHTYSKNGKLVSVAGAGYTEFTYDNTGRLKTKYSLAEGDYVKEEYQYGSDGQVIRIIETIGSEGCNPGKKTEKPCKVLQSDSFGNWTKRTVDGNSQERTITYKSK